MAVLAIKTVEDLEEDLRVLQAKCSLIEQRKSALLDAERAIRIEQKRIENQIHRLQKIQEKTPL